MKTKEDILEELRRSQAIYQEGRMNGRHSPQVHGRIMALEWVLELHE